jgi:D-alanyl-lipoteichoic acid acyltransferase DltB (MBOAT superfamily)
MLFNSYEFIFLFLPITFLIYFLLNRKKLTIGSKSWLVAASLFFYGWWNVKYLPLILGSILFNYAIGTTLGRSGQKDIKKLPRGTRLNRKILCAVGIVGNVVLLGYFKYVDFFIANINYLAAGRMDLLHIVLPLGISFFTFTQIAFLVDAYKGTVKEYDLLNYSLFVTFFPHLIAGPIIHHKEMMPQFSRMKNKVLNSKHIATGLFLFSVGLFKKVAIADNLAIWANNGFDTAQTLSFFEAWVTSLSYTFQIYFDFSGYTDMALGSALLFNIKLPANFNSPYKSLNIQEFWRRWHITLSRFLREYIYIPLGGNREGETRTYFNLLITFLVGGFWHGAGWTFIFWGFLHGSAIVIHGVWKKYNLHMNRALAWFLTFNFVNATWVFFRAKTWGDALKVLKAMCGLGEIRLPEFLSTKLAFLAQKGIKFGENLGAINAEKHTSWMILACLLLVILAKNSNQVAERFKPDWKNAIFVGFLATYAVFDLGKVTQFIYFQF